MITWVTIQVLFGKLLFELMLWCGLLLLFGSIWFFIIRPIDNK